MESIRFTRRQVLGLAAATPALGVIAGCRATLPPMSESASSGAGLALLEESVKAHGGTAYAALRDINVSYSGQWHRLVTRLQPDLVNAPFRGGSEERMLPRERTIAQSHTGPQGQKQVVRAVESGEGEVHVWFNGQESSVPVQRQAAALVADGYALFLLGPLWLASLRDSGRPLVVGVADAATVRDGKSNFLCDVLTVRARPGLGFAQEDRFALYIDRVSRLMRRVRFSLEGLESTQGALVEVDTLDSIQRFGIAWPTRFHERLLRPAPLKVHDWRLTGLDVNRGYASTDIRGQNFEGRAVEKAASTVV